MKKILIFVLVVAMCVSLVSLATAAEIDNSTEANTDSFYILSAQCPSAYVEYAQSNIARFILGSDDYELSDFEVFELGYPFSFSTSDADLFYFPVYGDGELIYLFRVFNEEEDSCGGVLSRFMVDELRELASESSQSHPISLQMEGKSIVATISDRSFTLFTYPDTYPVNNDTALTVCTDVELDVACIQPTSEIDFSAIPAPTADYMNGYLELHGYGAPRETQGANNWCVAYAASAIMRYIGMNDLTAAELMDECFGANNYTTLTSLAEAMVEDYANERGCGVVYTYSTLTSGEIASEIWADRPVYLVMERYEGTTRFGHAVVLRGFSLTAQTYSIWNPWYTYYETYTIDGTYVPAEHTSRQYTYDDTMYNWEYNEA